MSSLAKQLSGQHQKGMKNFAKGGAVKSPKHDDEAADKKLIAAAFKAKGLKKGGKCCE